MDNLFSKNTHQYKNVLAVRGVPKYLSTDKEPIDYKGWQIYPRDDKFDIVKGEKCFATVCSFNGAKGIIKECVKKGY